MVEITQHELGNIDFEGSKSSGRNYEVKITITGSHHTFWELREELAKFGIWHGHRRLKVEIKDLDEPEPETY